MGFLSWLRRVIADFSDARSDDLERAAEEAQRELQASKAVAALAVAQAQRSELELREALNQNPPSEVQLAGLVARLEDERSRATTLISRHRDLQERARKALEQLGEAQRITALNEGRESLRDFVTRTEATLDTEAVERLELEARAQAATLDVLETLDHGLPPPTARPATDEGNVRERAERLLRDGPYDRILQDG